MINVLSLTAALLLASCGHCQAPNSNIGNDMVSGFNTAGRGVETAYNATANATRDAATTSYDTVTGTWVEGNRAADIAAKTAAGLGAVAVIGGAAGAAAYAAKRTVFSAKWIKQAVENISGYKKVRNPYLALSKKIQVWKDRLSRLGNSDASFLDRMMPGTKKSRAALQKALNDGNQKLAFYVIDMGNFVKGLKQFPTSAYIVKRSVVDSGLPKANATDTAAVAAALEKAKENIDAYLNIEVEKIDPSAQTGDAMNEKTAINMSYEEAYREYCRVKGKGVSPIRSVIPAPSQPVASTQTTQSAPKLQAMSTTKPVLTTSSSSSRRSGSASVSGPTRR